MHYSFFTGHEHGHLGMYDETRTNGVFDTVEANSTTPLAGSYDLHCHVADGGAGSWGTGCWASVRVNTAFNIWRGFHSGSAILNDEYGFDLAFKFKVVHTPAGTNLMRILRTNSTETATGAGEVNLLCNGDSGGNIILNLATDSGNADVYTLTSGTTYLIRLRAVTGRTGASIGYAECWVMNTSGTVLGYASTSINSIGTDQFWLQFGPAPVLNLANFLDGEQDYYYDDIVVRGNVVDGDDSDPGNGTVVGLVPDADSSPSNWTAQGGGDSYADIDENVPSTTDYIYSDTSTVPDTDNVDFENYAGSGNELAVSVLMLHSEHTDNSSSDVFHRMGFDDGTNRDFHIMSGVGSTNTYEGHIIEFQCDGSTALTSAYIDTLDVFVERFLNLSGLNDKNVYVANVEIYDDTGRSAIDRQKSINTTLVT